MYIYIYTSRCSLEDEHDGHNIILDTGNTKGGNLIFFFFLDSPVDREFSHAKLLGWFEIGL